MEKKYLENELFGDTIYLKKHEISLATIMFDYICKDRERLSRFLPWPIHIKSVEDEIEFIKKTLDSWEKSESANYGIFRKIDDTYMGNLEAFHFDWSNESCEIGYWILGEFEGYGYMKDSVKTLEKELFRTGFNRIVILCEPDNIRSKSIPKKLDYTYEGLLHEVRKAHEKYINLEIYSKLKKKYTVLSMDTKL